MHYLITGGAGFIGSHLSELLLETGHQVTIIDDLSTGREENIAAFKDHANCKVHIESIENSELLAQLIQECDIVIHLAAAVGVRLVVENPVHTIQTNVLTTENLLKCAKQSQTKVLLASTSEVYGKSNKVPFSEEDDIILGPPTINRWSYACSKALDEFLAISYYKEYQLPVTIFRLFNTVGPRQTGSFGMVIPRMLEQACKGEELTVFGDGKQTRCFTFVKEVCNIIYALSQNEDAVGEVYNIGNNQEITIYELAQKIKQVANSNSPITLIPYEKAYGKDFEDMRRRVPNTDKLYQLLKLRPTVGIEEILQAMVKEHQI